MGNAVLAFDDKVFTKFSALYGSLCSGLCSFSKRFFALSREKIFSFQIEVSTDDSSKLGLTPGKNRRYLLSRILVESAFPLHDPVHQSLLKHEGE